MNTLPSYRAGIVGAIDPDATTAGTVTTDWVDASKYERFLGILMTGTLGSSGTVNAKIEQATDGAGTGVKDVDGKAITQLSQGAPNDSDKQALINLNADELDIAAGFTHVRLSVTVASAACDIGALLLGFDPRFGPASEDAADSVAEIVI